MKMDFLPYENGFSSVRKWIFIGMKIKLLSEARGDFLGRMKNSHGGTLISFVAIDIVLRRLLRYLPLNDQ